jgi:HD-GYP domain-containing protein (c-di-GMP phosphodiesterase class II)
MVEIISACDIYDALLSERPYRLTPYDNRTALEEITRMAQGGQLSWEVVTILVSYNRKDKPNTEECKVSTEKRGTPPAHNLYGVIVNEDPSTSGHQDT